MTLETLCQMQRLYFTTIIENIFVVVHNVVVVVH